MKRGAVKDFGGISSRATGRLRHSIGAAAVPHPPSAVIQCRSMIRCFYTAPLLELQRKGREHLEMHSLKRCATFICFGSFANANLMHLFRQWSRYLVDLLYTGCYSNDVGVSKMPNDFLLQRLSAKLSVWNEEEKLTFYGHMRGHMSLFPLYLE